MYFNVEVPLSLCLEKISTSVTQLYVFSIMDEIQSYTDKLRKTYRQSLGELIHVLYNLSNARSSISQRIHGQCVFSNQYFLIRN